MRVSPSSVRSMLRHWTNAGSSPQPIARPTGSTSRYRRPVGGEIEILDDAAAEQLQMFTRVPSTVTLDAQPPT
jgi:hypothetical protein